MTMNLENVVIVTESGAKLEVGVRPGEKPGSIVMVRGEGKALLGKRYICGQPVTVNDDSTIAIKPAGNTSYLTGYVSSVDGRKVNMGCGTTTLCLKSGNDAAIYCCGMPMAIQEPRKLASSD
ncbi:TPA: hypothetical protein HA231_05150 [Candidatus Woesearchaeota archaeon]|nr:hypothetical protein [Candidatus Woesearchaeota archaeon]